MGYVLRYIQPSKSGPRYRRRIPLDVQETLGKNWFTHPLGNPKDGLEKNWVDANEQFEQMVDAARLRLSGGTLRSPEITELTDIELHQELTRRLQAKNFNHQIAPHDPLDPHASDEVYIRDIEAERVISHYPVGEDGGPVGMTRADAEYVRALYSGPPEQPPPTLEDARIVYIENKGLNDPDAIKNLQRVNLVVKHVRNALGRNPLLTNLKRRDAREVMNYMLNDVGIGSSATVKRYLNDIRAIINHALREYDLNGIINPFTEMNPPKQGVAKDKRRPLTATELKLIRNRVAAKATDQLQLVWRLLESTGCRVSEITGLRVSDVFVNESPPYIRLEEHPLRRLKNDNSKREIPLTDDLLEVAKEALRFAGGNPMLFPRYGAKKGGGNNASAALMKHVRAVTDDRKAATHSLRHNMKDWLKEAGVSKQLQDEILGHTAGGDGEGYGGKEAQRRMAHQALVKAIEVRNR